MNTNIEVGKYKQCIDGETFVTIYFPEYVKDLEEKLRKAKEIYEKQYTIKYRKKRFMEDKTVGDLMYEVLIGSDKK